MDTSPEMHGAFWRKASRRNRPSTVVWDRPLDARLAHCSVIGSAVSSSILSATLPVIGPRSDRIQILQDGEISDPDTIHHAEIAVKRCHDVRLKLRPPVRYMPYE
jgi:hypothetical protein